ncbi:MAG: laccase domain-containing protein [Ktedonobacteraceae bacterium]
MMRHEQAQSPENLVCYTYNIFEPFSSQITCVTSTRLGGVSQGPLRSLNLSFRVGDDEQNVIANRLNLYNAVHVDPERVAQAQLVHGNHIEVVDDQSPIGLYEKFASTDGLVTSAINRSLFIPVADCAAVAFFDPLA